MTQAMFGRFPDLSRRLAAVLALLLASCGGSGSSGFDRGGLDGELIDRAIAEGRCLGSSGELLICPSGVDIPAPVGGEPTAPEGLRVAASVLGFGLDCPGSECGLRVTVEVAALPAEAEIRIASRVATAGPWSVGSPLALQLSSDGSGVVSPVGVDVAGGAPVAGEVQLAVLVFLSPLGGVPTSADALGETGADYAFVLEVGRPSS